MTRPKRKGRFLPPGEKTFHILQGEILHIGAHPTGFSILQHIVVGLNNTQAIEAQRQGCDVKVALKGTTFLGKEQTDNVLYFVIDIPKHFEEDIISSWRIQAYLEGTSQAIVEFSLHNWTYEYFDLRRLDKTGTTTTLTEIYMVDYSDDEDEEDGVVVSESMVSQAVRRERDRQAEGIRQRYAGAVVDPRTPAQRERERWEEREHTQRNNRQRTIWVKGEHLTIDGESFRIGHITDLGDTWDIRLEQKYKKDHTIRVPK